MASLTDIDPARQLADTERDLVAEFPRVSASEIHTLVDNANSRYDRAKVRGYVSILVAAAVRRTLRLRNTSAGRQPLSG